MEEGQETGKEQQVEWWLEEPTHLRAECNVRSMELDRFECA
jgi:hypothetical protein